MQHLRAKEASHELTYAPLPIFSNISVAPIIQDVMIAIHSIHDLFKIKPEKCILIKKEITYAKISIHCYPQCG